MSRMLMFNDMLDVLTILQGNSSRSSPLFRSDKLPPSAMARRTRSTAACHSGYAWTGSYDIWIWQTVRSDLACLDHTYPIYGSVCVGMHLANQSLFIDVASLLWAFKMGNPIDGNGKPITSTQDAFVDAGNLMYVFSTYVSLFLAIDNFRAAVPFHSHARLNPVFLLLRHWRNWS